MIGYIAGGRGSNLCRFIYNHRYRPDIDIDHNPPSISIWTQLIRPYAYSWLAVERVGCRTGGHLDSFIYIIMRVKCFP